MNAFLGWALNLDLDFFWRFVHALLNAFGGSKFGGLISKKTMSLSDAQPNVCWGLIFGLDLE